MFPLRIVGQALYPKNKDVIYIMQIVGKNIVSKVHAAELFKDKQLLNSLSPYDLLYILNISNKQNFSKKNNFLLFPCPVHYRMVSKSYDHITQQTIFTVEIIHSDKTIQKKLTALEIVNNPLIVGKLSPQETYDLGFTVGSETILKEIHKLVLLKNDPM